MIDILVNNAGIIKRIPMCEMKASEFRQVIDVDLNATFFVSITVWYGVFPLPWQCPQIARSLCSSNTHLALVASPFPAFTEAASGANCMICSSVRFNNMIILVSY